jgi:hypothetical protein
MANAVRAAIDTTDEAGDADTADILRLFLGRSTNNCGFSKRMCKKMRETLSCLS